MLDLEEAIAELFAEAQHRERLIDREDLEQMSARLKAPNAPPIASWAWRPPAPSAARIHRPALPFTPLSTQKGQRDGSIVSTPGRLMFPGATPGGRKGSGMDRSSRPLLYVPIQWQKG